MGLRQQHHTLIQGDGTRSSTESGEHTVDVQKKLDDIVAVVGSARSMPMSASCVINRAELLSLLEEVREALPGSLAQAQELLGGSEQLVEQARQEAERIIETAHAERGTLVSDTEIVHRSQAEADRILAEARREAGEIRAEADDYVDSKLANFEVVLTKTLGSVGRGREKLLGTGPGLDAAGYEDPDYTEAPERSQDPDTLRERADAYVDIKLGAFEAVLSKTLEAVGRGRQKLHGRVATDELGTLADSALGDPGQQHTSDAEYLADLADPATTERTAGRQTIPPPPQRAPAVAAAEQTTAAQLEQQALAQLADQQAAAAAQQPYPVDETDQHAYSVQDADQQAYAAQQPYPYQQQDGYSTLDSARAGGTPLADGYPQQDAYAGTLDYSPTLDSAPAGGTPLVDGTPIPQSYAQQQDPSYGYAAQESYSYQQDGYDPAQTAAAGSYEQVPGQTQPALDETSFFDTSMISAEQLRQYEQQRQYEQGR